MITLVVGNTYGRQTELVTGNETIRELLTTYNVGFDGTITIDGVPVFEDEFDQPLNSFEIGNKVFLMSIIKSNNN